MLTQPAPAQPDLGDGSMLTKMMVLVAGWLVNKKDDKGGNSSRGFTSNNAEKASNKLTINSYTLNTIS